MKNVKNSHTLIVRKN